MRIRLSNNRIFAKMGRIFNICMASFYVFRNKTYILMANTKALNACVTICEVQRPAHKTVSKYSPSNFRVKCIIRTYRTFWRKCILFQNLNLFLLFSLLNSIYRQLPDSPATVGSLPLPSSMFLRNDWRQLFNSSSPRHHQPLINHVRKKIHYLYL